MLRLVARQQMDGREPFSAPVGLELRATIAIPKSWSKKKQRAALIGEILPATRPDLSNLLKLGEDALTGVVFADDSLICLHRTQKEYGTTPKIVLTVRTLNPGDNR